jgi:type I restriction enzyme R subunit
MTSPDHDWTEQRLVEDTAIAQLESLGWAHVMPDEIAAERRSFAEAFLPARLAAAVRRLNPWISEENLERAVRAITQVPATGLMDASERAHTALAYGVSVVQDLGDGRRSRDVRFLDFERSLENDLVVARQFRVRGAKHDVIPDLVLFVNGLPLVIIECKSSDLGLRWLAKAVGQLREYQEAEPHQRGEGAPQLFTTAQLLVATCGQGARVGTVGTPLRFFDEWNDTYPLSRHALAEHLGRYPNPQQILIQGVLAPEILLDITRSFVVFDREEGRPVRKIPRYNQYRAVQRAIERVHTRGTPKARGGVVWHTQGTGKSLSMLWLATKLRREPALENPTLLVVTDRTDLDEQITKKFLAAGFPGPVQARSARHLRGLLSGGGGATVLATIQLFRELAEDAADPQRGGLHQVLSTAENLFVLVDEAHRTEYGHFAANLERALPNATRFAFTGTPIDRKERSTTRTFGSYVDKYTIEQATADGVVLKIYYESRLPEDRIVGASLDTLFERVFADRTLAERREIQRKYGTALAVAEAPRRIEAICLDLLDHYATHIAPGGYKAQIVAPSRRAAVTYKETLDRLHGPESALVLDWSDDEEGRIARYALGEREEKDLIERFKRPGDPLALLIVCDRLLTGFDAPVEQVLYLDKPLRDHGLLQAIARVNRKTADGRKEYGLVIDYWGVSDELQEALAIFAPQDVEGALAPIADELPRLAARHRAALRFFDGMADRGDLEACLRRIDPEDVRAEFDLAFRRFAESVELFLPDPRALPYEQDLRWLGKIRQAAAVRFRDDRLDVSDCGAKARKLIEDAIVAEGVRVLVERVSLFSDAFDAKLAALAGDEARASEVEHALKAEIHLRLDENPAFYVSLQKRLEEILDLRRRRRIEAAEQLKLLLPLVEEVRREAAIAQELGLSTTGFAIYGLLPEEPRRQDEAAEPGAPGRAGLAAAIDAAVAPLTAIVDWRLKDDVQREMRRETKRRLRASGITGAEADGIAADVLDALRAREDR